MQHLIPVFNSLRASNVFKVILHKKALFKINCSSTQIPLVPHLTEICPLLTDWINVLLRLTYKHKRKEESQHKKLEVKAEIPVWLLLQVGSLQALQKQSFSQFNCEWLRKIYSRLFSGNYSLQLKKKKKVDSISLGDHFLFFLDNRRV